MPLIPQDREDFIMSEAISLIVGLLLGGCVASFVMCCLQINRLYNTDKKKEVKYNEKKNR